MTLSSNLHKAFRNFYFAFEETARPNRYRIKSYRPRLDSGLPGSVTFHSYDQRYPLPSPELLKVYAILARIFHESGAAEMIRQALCDIREHRVLAKDGSTDISSMLAVTTLRVLGSRTGNVLDSKTSL